MSTAALTRPGTHRLRFWETTVGKKVVMALTGIVLFGFVLGHMVGNLQFFLGPESLNHYGQLLRVLPEALWAVRIFLLICVGLHIWSSVALATKKLSSRPVGYKKWKPTVSSYASRTMYWSGPIILVFVIYHILDLTVGAANPHFQEGMIYQNVVASFSNPLVAGFYIFAMALLCMHLYHGLWSMFQSLGASHPKYTPLIQVFAKVFAFVIFFGFIAVPIAVLAGVGRS